MFNSLLQRYFRTRWPCSTDELRNSQLNCFYSPSLCQHHRRHPGTRDTPVCQGRALFPREAPISLSRSRTQQYANRAPLPARVTEASRLRPAPLPTSPPYLGGAHGLPAARQLHPDASVSLRPEHGQLHLEQALDAASAALQETALLRRDSELVQPRLGAAGCSPSRHHHCPLRPDIALRPPTTTRGTPGLPQCTSSDRVRKQTEAFYSRAAIFSQGGHNAPPSGGLCQGKTNPPTQPLAACFYCRSLVPRGNGGCLPPCPRRLERRP